MKLQHKLVGLGLLGVAVGSSALSLGRARGNVVLGQPLSLAVEVRVDQVEDASAQCFRVEVFHGDTLLEASRVRVVVQAPAAGSQDAVLRIRSSAVVDEPVLGVVVHALCGQRGERRYDFLPDFPAELQAAQKPVDLAALPAPAAVPAPVPTAPIPVAPPPAAATAGPAPAPAAAPAPRTRANTEPAARPAQPRRAAASPAPARPAAARAPAPAAAARPAKAPRPAAPKAAAPAVAVASAPDGGSPRLTLDVPQGRGDGLQPSPALNSGPIDDAAQREAVAAIWRALRTTPEEVVRDKQRLEALEAQQTQQSKLAAQPSAAERELRLRLERAERRLDEAESGRVDILLVYGLLALLALVVALAAYFWSRARNAALAAVHWSGEDRPSMPASVEPIKADAPFTFRPAAVARASLADEFLDSEPASALAAVRPSGVDTDAVAAAVFAHDRMLPVDASRPVRPDEYFDVQQHADFFVSLGQYEQAIEVLKQHLDEHRDMSPLAFLDLFGIYHQLGHKDDFNALRARFQQRFNAHIPNFAAFADEGLGLEDYPATMLSIETAWGNVRVLDTIEANLLRRPDDTGRPLDLAAYRDLLVLYGVAQDVFVAAGSIRPAAELESVAVPAATLAARPVRESLLPAAPLLPPLVAPVVLPAAAAAAADPMVDLVPDSAHAGLPSLDDALGLELDVDLTTTTGQVAAPALLSLVEVDIDLPLLDDDFSSAAMASPPPSAPASASSELGHDSGLIDFEVSGSGTTPPSPPPPAASVSSKPEYDSGLIDFDLFDPNTEARIAPKSTR